VTVDNSSIGSGRVCVVAPEFLGPLQNGGVGTSCFWQATALARAGIDVTVLYTGPTERESADDWECHHRAAGLFTYVDLWSWSRRAGADVRLDRWALPAHDARASQLVLEYLREHEFDVILFQEFLGHGARTLQAQRAGVALQRTHTVVTLHSCRRWIYEGTRRASVNAEDSLVDFLEHESARLADRVIAPSQHMAVWASRRWRLDRRIDVLPNCYDEVAAVVDPPVVNHRGPFTHLVFFGRLETRKGIHLFSDALATSGVLRQHVRQVTFLGRHARVGDRPSEEFLAETCAALPWLRVDVKSDMGSLEALAWLGAQRDTLVVAPSIADNLPYAVVELHARRIPFVSTHIGGIPEIVGAANHHQLAPATTDGIRRRLEEVCTQGLEIDYRDGYDATAARDRQVAFVNGLRAVPAEARQSHLHNEPLTVVVAGARDETTLAEVQRCFATAGVALPPGSQWCTPESWRERRGPHAALFLASSVRPGPGFLEGYRAAAADARTHVVTSFYECAGPGSTTRTVVAPFGASPEHGWRSNCFGGPCFIAAPAAFEVLDEVIDEGFGFWAAYAAMTCAELSLAVIPQPLYVSDDAEAAGRAADLPAVIAWYSDARLRTLDPGWMLKMLRPLMATADSSSDAGGVGRGAARGHRLHDQLLALPDDALRAYGALDPMTPDPFFRQLAGLRARLAPLLDAWDREPPRVIVYGAGIHTRLLLAAFPDLGRFVTGFIDRRPMRNLLGKPCITPEQFHESMADVVLYSSREFERDMYAAMAGHAVEHVLLYARFTAPLPVAPPTGVGVAGRA